VAFYNPKYPRLYERLIRWKTGSWLVHCELVFDELSPTMNGFWTSFSSTLRTGSRFQNKINFLSSEWTLIQLPAPPQAVISKAWDFCSGLGHKRYDLLGILGFVLPWGGHDDYDVFCSEVVTQVIQYQYGDGFLFPVQKPWTVSPARLFQLLRATGVGKV
jgi:hypothetical protein